MMGDFIIGTVIGVAGAFFLSAIVGIVVFEAGHNACVDTTDAEKCVKEWRPVE